MNYKGVYLEECLLKNGVSVLGRKHNFRNLCGHKVGKWYVICRAPNDVKTETTSSCTVYWCECECGSIRKIRARELVSGNTRGCVKCSKQRMFTGRVDKVGEIPVSFWKRFKNKAVGSNSTKKRANLEFTVTLEEVWHLYEKQRGLCAISGIPIGFCTIAPLDKKGYKAHWKHTASLDRVDNAKGYIKDNLQWVHKDVNYMKQDYDQDYFIKMCKKIAEHRDLC